MGAAPTCPPITRRATCPGLAAAAVPTCAQRVRRSRSCHRGHRGAGRKSHCMIQPEPLGLWACWLSIKRFKPRTNNRSVLKLEKTNGSIVEQRLPLGGGGSGCSPTRDTHHRAPARGTSHPAPVPGTVPRLGRTQGPDAQVAPAETAA